MTLEYNTWVSIRRILISASTGSTICSLRHRTLVTRRESATTNSISTNFLLAVFPQFAEQISHLMESVGRGTQIHLSWACWDSDAEFTTPVILSSSVEFDICLTPDLLDQATSCRPVPHTPWIFPSGAYPEAQGKRGHEESQGSRTLFKPRHETSALYSRTSHIPGDWGPLSRATEPPTSGAYAQQFQQPVFQNQHHKPRPSGSAVFDFDWADKNSDEPPVPWWELEAYQDFVTDKVAHEFWTWDPKVEKWSHRDEKTGEVIFCPDELD